MKLVKGNKNTLQEQVYQAWVTGNREAFTALSKRMMAARPHLFTVTGGIPATGDGNRAPPETRP